MTINILNYIHMSLIIPKDYTQTLTPETTEQAIQMLKTSFQEKLSKALNLRRVTAPLFVLSGTGINDDLNGVERAVSFPIHCMGERQAEVVHSLAKWKRMALKRYGFSVGEGLYTDMSAIRRDEDTDNLHSLYVDQWDWEKVITRADRTREYLRDTVKNIVAAMNETETVLTAAFPGLQMHIPSEVHFVSTEELERMYPDKTPREREDIVCREYGCVFLEGIGAPLPISGKPHDGRAPDYDDWSLNGDILIWYEPLGRALELSSMGIRVDPDSLASQLRAAGVWERSKLEFHRMLLAGELPLTIGGGIGQSRLSMAMTDKVHIGEVQCSVWPEDMYKVCGEHGIFLL